MRGGRQRIGRNAAEKQILRGPDQEAPTLVWGLQSGFWGEGLPFTSPRKRKTERTDCTQY